MNFSDLPQLHPYPDLRRLVRVQLDMQLEDVKTLLRLPHEGNRLAAGCNLTLATLLFNVVAGSSVLFYRASRRGMADARQNRERFEGVLKKAYPFGAGDLDDEIAAKMLYQEARNPLSHSLGVGKDQRIFPGAPKVNRRGVAVMFAKRVLSEAEVDELATARERPPWMKPTVSQTGDVCTVQTVTLAWGVHEMLRRLFEDETQAKKADELAKRLFDGPMPASA